MTAKQQFKHAVEATGGVAKAAGRLGCSRAFIYQLMDEADRRKPSRAKAALILSLFGVPAEAWDLHAPADGKAA